MISAWYFYLLIWYGPSSIFAALGSKYVVGVENHPWQIRDDMLITSILSAMLLQAIPLVLNIVVYKKAQPLFKLLFLRLEPLFGHVSCFWFGILGTLAQLYAAFSFGDLWLKVQFDFGSLSLIQKSVLSGFFMFTIGPQVSLLLYKHFKPKSSLSGLTLNAFVCLSFLCGLYAFTAFGQRTYVLLEIFLIAYLLLSSSVPYKRLVIGILPVALFVGYTVTSRYNRIRVSQDPVEILTDASKRLVDDFSYRSHIANDSVLIGARSCVLDQLNDSGLTAGSLFPIELASGLPQPIRQALPLDIAPFRLETLVGDCYRSWLGMTDAKKIDLSDSKGQYFLIMFGQIIAPFVSSAFWLLLHFSFILLIYIAFSFGLRFVAFSIPASVHFLVLGTTPGEIFVVVKAIFPYLLIMYIISFFWRNNGNNSPLST